jgi:hypothetical protein
MGIFDLVFIAVVLLSLVTLLAVVGVAVTGRFRTAGRLLAGWIVFVAGYLAIVVVVSFFARPRQIAVRENVCFDDWCIAVDTIEHGTIVFVQDTNGQRYDSRTPGDEPPFDVLLSAGETLRTRREFDPPASATPLRLVITHEGGFPIGWFIIGVGPFSRGIQLPLR